MVWPTLARLLRCRHASDPVDDCVSLKESRDKISPENSHDQLSCVGSSDSSTWSDDCSDSSYSRSDGEDDDSVYDDDSSHHELSPRVLELDPNATYSRSALIRKWRQLDLPPPRQKSASRHLRVMDSSSLSSARLSASRTSSSKKVAASPSSWSEAQRLRRESAPDDIGRSVKSILNKLTVEKFDELCTQLTKSDFCTQAHVEMLVRAILTEAQVARSQAAVYADLCCRVIADFGDAEYLIKRALRIECRQRFDAFLASAKAFDALDEETYLVQKLCMIGHVRFIGELVVRNILSSQELFMSVVNLLQQPMCPQSLEALAALLTVVGPKLDVADWPQHAKLQVVFGQVEDLARDSEVPSRVRYLFRDLLDLRKASWVDTKQATSAEGPKRLEEVRQEAEDASLDTLRQRRCGGTYITEQETNCVESEARRRRRGGERERRRRRHFQA